MPTAISGITRIQDADDFAAALTWAGLQTFDAGASIASGQGITMADDTWIGIASDAERIVFDAAGDVSVMGANVGIDAAAPDEKLRVVGGNIKVDDAAYIFSAGALSVGGLSTVEIETYEGGWKKRMHVANNGLVGIGTTSPDRLLHPEVSDAVTNAVTHALRLSHITSGVAAQYFGVGVEFELEDAGGGMDVASTINSYWSNPAAGSERGAISLRVRNADGTFSTGILVSGGATAPSAGFFGTGQLQQPHIVDAVTDAAYAAGAAPTKAEFDALVDKFNANWAKFNTWLADAEGYGLLKAA